MHGPQCPIRLSRRGAGGGDRMPHQLILFSLLLEWIARVFWTLDILLSFFTGTFVSGNLELRPSRIFFSYVRTLQIDIQEMKREMKSILLTMNAPC